MSWFMVDVETDGSAPGLYSMIQIGVIIMTKTYATHVEFFGQLKPISKKYLPEALACTGISRKDTEAFDDPEEVMHKFYNWIRALNEPKTRPMFISDNNGFDFAFINYYFWRFLGENPFGHSSTNLGSLYHGWKNDMFHNFKHLRKTEHTHNPVDDARGNAEALYEMIRQGFKFKL